MYIQFTENDRNFGFVFTYINAIKLRFITLRSYSYVPRFQLAIDTSFPSTFVRAYCFLLANGYNLQSEFRGDFFVVVKRDIKESADIWLA